MLKALILLIAACPLQERTEKIKIQHVDAKALYERLMPKDGASLVPQGVKQVAHDPTDNSIIARGTPEAIRALLDLIAEFDVAQMSRVVPVKNVSARYLYELVTMTGRFEGSGDGKGFVPDGAKLSVDKESNGIVAAGSPDAMREIADLIAQLDVRPHPVTLEVQGTIASMGREIEYEGDVVNNATWTYLDESADTELRIHPRVNGDRTVTLSIAGQFMGRSVSQHVRLRPGETLYMRTIPPFVSQPTSGFARYFVLEVPIDEEAFLRGDPLSGLRPTLRNDTSPALEGEFRLIVRAKAAPVRDEKALP